MHSGTLWYMRLQVGVCYMELGLRRMYEITPACREVQLDCVKGVTGDKTNRQSQTGERIDIPAEHHPYITYLINKPLRVTSTGFIWVRILHLAQLAKRRLSLLHLLKHGRGISEYYGPYR